MGELIKLILSKKSWETKIYDEDIINKWKNEFIKQNINPIIINLVIELLKKYTNNKNKSEEEYKWIYPLIINYPELYKNSDCNCCCKICKRCEHYYEEDYSIKEWKEIYKKNKFNPNIKCSCTPHKLNLIKNSILNKYTIEDNNLINEELKNEFIDQIKLFESNIDNPDYHPGSNDQVIDLIHPSIYPYVKGLSEITNSTNLENNKDESVLFQWLPSEVDIIRDDKNIYSVNFESSINNLDKNKFCKLHESIENIFKFFVNKFESMFNILYQNRILKKQIISKPRYQVIVKLSNTILTPEKPIFDASSWHLEGLEYERIIATGIYYYSMENIQDNFLEFRSTIDDYSINYPQNCREWVHTHYGIKHIDYNDMESTINLGKIKTIENMCLVFPNFLQHKVSELKLIDTTKPGHRKILVFFLIDPDNPIISTNNVKSIKDKISFEDALLIREMLMFERKFEIDNQKKFYERGWSLCEH